jgi:hypothetical protein
VAPLGSLLGDFGRPAAVVGAEEIQSDQWTLGRLRRERPLFRIAFDDPEQTNIYVSGSNAQVVHWTTATERFWSNAQKGNAVRIG